MFWPGETYWAARRPARARRPRLRCRSCRDLVAQKVQGSRNLRVLVLAPTRELALQIGESFQTYGRYTPMRQVTIFGGVNQNPQIEKLRRGADILVATPGRLIDLMGQGYIRLDRLEVLVLDEADRMLDMGFIHDVRRIIAAVPTRRQTLMFSATMPPEILSLAKSILTDPVTRRGDASGLDGGHDPAVDLLRGEERQTCAA